MVRSLCDVKKPSGYLVPKQWKEVTDWVERQSLRTEIPVIAKDDKIEQYEISEIDSIDFEGDKVIDPRLVLKDAGLGITLQDYIYVPVSQLKGNMLVIALEPKSMLGLVTYKNFAHLMGLGKYPILRVTKK